MHPKLATDKSPRSSEVFVDTFFASVLKEQGNEKLRESLLLSDRQKEIDTNFNDDEWLEEEALNRDNHLTTCLSHKLQSSLQNSRDFTLSYCPELTKRIAEEISRASLNEPGGLAACRIQLNIVTSKEQATPIDCKDQKCRTIALDSFDVSDESVVGTFEVQVYLFPSTSVLSWLQSFVTSLSLRKSSKSRSISLLTDFVLVKRKLFRSNSNNSLVVIKSIAK